MDSNGESRAREMVDDLKAAGMNHGLLLMNSVVVMRGPGSPYVDTPMIYDASDLQNAIDLKLVEKAKVSGSYSWEWYVAKS